MSAHLLALVLLATAAEDPTAAAKELVQEGQKLYAQGRFLEAIEKFEGAQALKPHPGLHYNIARCHEELGHPAKALRSYREYLRYMPKVDDRPAVEKSMAALQRTLADSGVMQLRVVATPGTASIFIDTLPAGPTPAYVEVRPGAHVVAATAPGHARMEREVNVTLGALAEVTLELVPVRDEPPAAPPLVDAPPPPSDLLVPKPAPAPAPAPLATQAPAPPPQKKSRVFTWVALGTGVAAAGSGLGFGLGANAASDELRRRPHATPEADNLVKQTQAFATTANVSWGVAAVAGVAAVVLFFVEGAQ